MHAGEAGQAYPRSAESGRIHLVALTCAATGDRETFLTMGCPSCNAGSCWLKGSIARARQARLQMHQKETDHWSMHASLLQPGWESPGAVCTFLPPCLNLLIRLPAGVWLARERRCSLLGDHNQSERTGGMEVGGAAAETTPAFRVIEFNRVNKPAPANGRNSASGSCARCCDAGPLSHFWPQSTMPPWLCSGSSPAKCSRGFAPLCWTRSGLRRREGDSRLPPPGQRLPCSSGKIMLKAPSLDTVRLKSTPATISVSVVIAWII